MVIVTPSGDGNDGVHVPAASVEIYSIIALQDLHAALERMLTVFGKLKSSV